MLKALFSFSLLILILCATSCSEGDNCTSGQIEALCLGDLGCNNAERLVTLKSDKELELIRSQADYERLIETPCEINIDWQQYDLIVGNLQLSQGFIGLEKSAVFDCVENRIEMTISIFLSNTTNAPTITWSFLVPKNSDFFLRPVKFN